MRTPPNQAQRIAALGAAKVSEENEVRIQAESDAELLLVSFLGGLNRILGEVTAGSIY
jgi:hypothetical protein